MWRSLDRASVASPWVRLSGLGPDRRGRLTPRNNRPDYLSGSRPLANAASGVERPPRDL
jgi:hypothetical protein